MSPRVKRLLPVLLCVAFVAFLLARGAPPPETTEDATGDEQGPAPIPLPPLPEPEPPAVRAPGTYIYDAPGMRVSLELMKDRRFRFLATREGAVREGHGTWSLTGSRLSLAYTHLGGNPVGEEPVVVVNVWRETSIELRDTGGAGRVVLTKRTVIRHR